MLANMILAGNIIVDHAGQSVIVDNYYYYCQNTTGAVQMLHTFTPLSTSKIASLRSCMATEIS